MAKKLTTAEFIEKARKVHGDKYAYNKVKYNNSHTKVCIVCPKHGEFWVLPVNFLRGHGCPVCSGNKPLSTEEFIRKAKEIHKSKDDYSKVEYKNNKTEVCIICPQHGEYWQTPNKHLSGCRCPKCAIEQNANAKRRTLEDFIKLANITHNNTYIYDESIYVNANTPLKIICQKHGEFWQTPDAHLRGHGCPKCGTKKLSQLFTRTAEEFIAKAKQIHGDKYDYSKVKYVNSKVKACIICPEHGEFWQTPDTHLQGRGCPKCKIASLIACNLSSTDDFIKKATVIHKGKYIYTDVDYKDAHTKVKIICPEHGEFFQTPNSHLNGNGCPKCNSSKLETEIRLLLQNQGINFEEQKRFDWLGLQSLDFYLPEQNIAIECQGVQHYRPVHFFGGNTGLQYSQQCDTKKKQLCESNEVKLIYYTHEDIIPDDATCFTQEALLEKIAK